MPTTSRTCHEHSDFKIGRSGMASTVPNGIDRPAKWHRPFQMATSVYETENCRAVIAAPSPNVFIGTRHPSPNSNTYTEQQTNPSSRSRETAADRNVSNNSKTSSRKDISFPGVFDVCGGRCFGSGGGEFCSRRAVSIKGPREGGGGRLSYLAGRSATTLPTAGERLGAFRGGSVRGCGFRVWYGRVCCGSGRPASGGFLPRDPGSPPPEEQVCKARPGGPVHSALSTENVKTSDTKNGGNPTSHQ
ncbi:hypothetical protein Bbelb_050820 [Branchiostoma belcheri]|nr:hypothetical protein Bbelb_050820 [Branchiostoma belcheri]